MEMPQVYLYNDFASYFRDLCAARKTKRKNLSYRWLAQKIGLKSHSYIVRIASGKHVPTLEMTTVICRLLEVSPDQTIFAKTLVERELAKTAAAREQVATRLNELRKGRSEQFLDSKNNEILFDWLSVAILELISCAGWQDDARWIAGRFGNNVTEARVRECLMSLVEAKILERDQRTGKLYRKKSSLTTSHNISSTAIRSFHREMLAKAEQTIDALPVSERCFLGHTLAIPESQLKDAFDALIEMRQRFSNRFATTTGKAENVFHLSIQLFPLTSPE